MKLGLSALALLLTCSGCVGGPPIPLSGPIVEQSFESGGAGLTIGFVADSQLQTRRNYNLIPFYRGPREDARFNVSMRPPALDWASRSILKFELDQLATNGAKAIFYLGDGANNGCYDEFALGFEDGSAPAFNDKGILRLLDDFRKTKGVPVYFVIGNHDMLGAGSTSKKDRRFKFCEDLTGGDNRSLVKSEVIGLVDRFNRANARFGSQWQYRSSFDEAAIKRDCGSNSETQHRRWGCYLAAKLDYGSGNGAIQFLLLDTTDFVSVSKSEVLGVDQEGLRGAMSFGEREGEQTVSQSVWFDQNASETVPLRMAVSHYDIPGLRKNISVANLSRKSQRFADLFLKNTDPIEATQTDAYVVTAHTHYEINGAKEIPFKLNCGKFFCRPGGKIKIGELNIGSTTDYANYATLVRVNPIGDNKMLYRRVESEPPGCADVNAAMENYEFKDKQVGWEAIGVSHKNSVNYRDFTYKNVAPIWTNLEEFAGTDQHRAKCIGLYAAAVEKKVDPVHRLPPKSK